jgi:hypothetical protein
VTADASSHAAVEGGSDLADISRWWTHLGLQPVWRKSLDRHIMPALGRTPTGKVTPSQFRGWHASLHRRHAPTAAPAYRLVAAIFGTVIDGDLVAGTPYEVKGASTEHPAERPTPTPAEVGSAAAAAHPRFRQAILLAA